MLMSTIHSGIIHYIRTLNTDQWTETVVQRCALSVIFNVICYAHVWCRNHTNSRILRAVVANVIIFYTLVGNRDSCARMCCVWKQLNLS